MSDENRDLESAEAGFSALPSVGSQLKAAREKRQMSVGDVAMALKLGARQVEAVENGDWQRLPGHTFIRGFVRNYARLLQLDPAPLMAQLDDVLETPLQRLSLTSGTQATMPQTGRTRQRDYAVALIGLALVVVATGVYFLLPADISAWRHDVQALIAKVAGKDEAAKPEAAAPEPVFPPGTTPQQVMNPQAVVPAEPPAAPASVSPALVPPPVLQQGPAAAAAPAQPAAAAGGALHFSVQQESWVEVRDRNGMVVFSQRLPAGAEQDVAGQGPFALVIGNAPGVKLRLRGQPVDLAPHTNGNVARFTLD